MKRSSKLIALLAALPISGVMAERNMEEVIVTATKRAESIQDVPIAISAFKGEDLEARGVQDLYGLQEVSPSISVYSANSESNGGTIRIRGVGTTGNNPGLEAAVGTFIDGVYRSRAGLAFSDLTDIERIEILRGPQGTLFGKNTSAGALHIITKKPEFERSSMLSISAGDYGSFRVQGSTTGALIDDVLAFRVAGSYNERDGFYEDDFSSDDYNGRDRYSFKAQLLWAPTDAIESRFIFDYTDKDEDCCPARYDAINTVQQADSSTSRGTLQDGEIPGNLVADLIAQQVGRPAPSTDHFDVGLNFKPFERVEEWGIQNETTWHINDNLTMVSITAYREFDVERGQDVDFSAANILEPQNTEESFENFSQEFQFTWSTDTVDFLAGVYIYTEDIKTNENLRLASQGGEYLARLQTGLIDQALSLPAGFLQSNPNSTLGTSNNGSVGNDRFGQGTTSIGGYNPVTRQYEVNDELRANHSPGDGYFADFGQDTEGWSIFTHNVWHATDRLDLTFGARYSNEKKEAVTRINGIDPLNGTTRELLQAVLDNTFNEAHCTARAAVGALCDNASWEDENTEKEWTGTIKASYALTDEINVYASISRGYKAGGFNLDQQAIEIDVFATHLATGGDARFLTTSGRKLFDTNTEGLAEIAALGVARENGLTQFACGNQTLDSATGTVVNAKSSDIDCAFFDDDHAFDPEFVDAFELGFKGEFFEGDLIANIALFYSEFEDFQLNTFSGTGFLVSNTDEMISKGVEIETTWFITDGVILSFGMTYADARYGDDLNAKGETEASLYTAQNYTLLEDFQALEDIEGKQITHAPYWQGSASLFVEKPIGNYYGYGNLNIGYRGAHNTGSDLDDAKKVSDKAIVNMQLGIRTQDDRWDLQLWSRNLTDTEVESIIFNSVFQSGGSFSTFVGPPRMSGITLTSHF